MNFELPIGIRGHVADFKKATVSGTFVRRKKMNKWFWGICLGLDIVVTCYNIHLTHKNIEEDKKLMAKLQEDSELDSKLLKEVQKSNELFAPLLKEIRTNEDLTETLNKKTIAISNFSWKAILILAERIHDFTDKRN